MRGFLAAPWAVLLLAGAVPVAAGAGTAAGTAAGTRRLGGKQAWHAGEAVVARETARTASGLPKQAQTALADVRGQSDLELVLAARVLPPEGQQSAPVTLLQGRATAPANTLGYAEDS